MHDILKKAKQLENDHIQFLRDVVKLPYGSGKESDVVARIMREMEDIGYDEVKVDKLGNLFGRLGNGPRVLVIDGHCDVVAIGNRENWDVDPVGGEIIDGELYGRGSCDQKCPTTSRSGSFHPSWKKIAKGCAGNTS